MRMGLDLRVCVRMGVECVCEDGSRGCVRMGLEGV